MELVFPTIGMKEDVMAYRQEFLDAGAERIEGSGGLSKVTDYEGWIAEKVRAQSVAEDGWVRHTTYFAVVGGEIVGNVNIRHELNEELRFDGGHVGYAVRPTKRRRGYATQMLGLALEKCRELGIDRALVTCVKENVGSAKTILNNGGVLDSEFVDADGVVSQRYWVEV